VERVVLNALIHGFFPIVFGEADPPLAYYGGTVAAATPQRVDPVAAGQLCRLIICAFGDCVFSSVRALHGESSTGLAIREKSIHLSHRRRLTQTPYNA
jgi:hypothetical protein